MQTVGFGTYWAESARKIPDKGDLRDYWIGISSAGDFLGTAPRSQAPEKAWVAMGLERQPDAAAGAPTVAEDAPAVDEGDQARMDRLEEDVHEIRGALTEQREVIDAMARNFSRFSTWAITGLAWMMDKAEVAYVPYSETHVPYQRRRVRQRTGEASTSATQQDPQEPDP
ncbi:hypothetical protein Tco_0874318 [Tanacetum coccineum]|uniref:Uncharacterized protein n=1 Tax=Tanacetum coccineum TaxID=301880 RepID=A0ABQ5BP87_9ASTR